MIFMICAVCGRRAATRSIREAFEARGERAPFEEVELDRPHPEGTGWRFKADVYFCPDHITALDDLKAATATWSSALAVHLAEAERRFSEATSAPAVSDWPFYAESRAA